MGIMTAALLLLTNTRELLSWGGIKGTSSWAVYAAVAAVIAFASFAPRAFGAPARDQAT
jgi:hypothetical protein